MKIAQINAIILANKLWPPDGHSYRDYMTIRATLKDDVPIEAKWLGWNSWNRPPDIHKESTYEDCTVWSYDAKKQTILIVVWDGDMLDGNPERERASWIYAVRDEHTAIVELIEARVNQNLRYQAEAEEVAYQQEQHKLRVDARVAQKLKEVS